MCMIVCYMHTVRVPCSLCSIKRECQNQAVCKKISRLIVGVRYIILNLKHTVVVTGFCTIVVIENNVQFSSNNTVTLLLGDVSR